MERFSEDSKQWLCARTGVSKHLHMGYALEKESLWTQAKVAGDIHWIDPAFGKDFDERAPFILKAEALLSTNTSPNEPSAWSLHSTWAPTRRSKEHFKRTHLLSFRAPQTGHWTRSMQQCWRSRLS